MTVLRGLVVLVLLLAGPALAAKILFYNPLFGQSHVNFMTAIGRVLVEEGHDVTVLVPIVNPTIHFDSTSFKKVIMVDLGEEVHNATQASFSSDFIWEGSSDSLPSIVSMTDGLGVIFYKACHALLREEELLETLKKEKFDLGMAEYFDACGVGLFHLLGLKKTILTNSAVLFEHTAEVTGVRLDSNYVPAAFNGVSIRDLQNSIFERLRNFVLLTASSWSFDRVIGRSQDVFDERFGDFPRLKDLAANTSLVFVNSDPLLDNPAPTLGKMVYIGGVHSHFVVTKNLSQEWKNLLELRNKTVLISFGSVAKTILMPRETKLAIVEVARRFPDVTFIWKYEHPDDEIGRGVENLVKTAWMPQNELLHSGKISVFVTHGGMASTLEGASSGIPLLAIGLFADQPRNAAMLASHGSAIALEKEKLANPSYLEGALNKVLNDESYAKNAKRLAAQLKARPFSPRELLARHTAFVAEHGPLHQTTPGSTRMNFWQKHFVDALALLTSIVVAVTWLIIFSVRFVIQRLVITFKSPKAKQA